MITPEFNTEILDVNQNKEELLEQVNNELQRLKQKMINQNSGEYVLNLIGDYALIARKDNGFIPLNKEQRSELEKIKGRKLGKVKIYKDLDEDNNGLMTEANYDRILREQKNELLKLDVWNKKCVMITLTTDPALKVDYDMLHNAVRAFYLRLYRLFGAIPSVKRYEYGGRTQMLHTHYLLFFDNKIPDILTEE